MIYIKIKLKKMRKLKAKQKCAGATSIFGKNKPRYFKFKEGNDSP